MVEFKKRADAYIKERWGIEVEHVCATVTAEELRDKFGIDVDIYNLVSGGGKTSHIRECVLPQAPEGESGRSDNRLAEDLWRVVPERIKNESAEESDEYGRKCQRGGVQAHLRGSLLPGVCRRQEGRTDVRLAISEGALLQQSPEGQDAQSGGTAVFSDSPSSRGAHKNSVIQYVGIASDEPERLARLDGVAKISPLAAAGWDEAKCRRWCEENGLLSPIYTTSTRGGCWFCHNQGVDQLRILRRIYPDLWQIMLRWDADSPVTFKANGHTVHDYDKRFQLEDAGLIDPDKRFLWKCVSQYDLSPAGETKTPCPDAQVLTIDKE